MKLKINSTGVLNNPTSQSQSAIPRKGEFSSKGDFASVLANSNQKGTAVNNDVIGSLSNLRSSPKNSKNSMGKDDFLKLFVAQLKNQDPLKPKDGAEIASQLAQFNSVEQMVNVNKTLERIEHQSAEDQQFKMLAYVGKQAFIDNNKVSFNGEAVRNLSAVSTSVLLNAEMQVVDSDGNVVFTKNLGALKSGRTDLEWKGLNTSGEKVKPGTYSVSVVSRDGNEEYPVKVETGVMIKGLDVSSGKTALTTENGSIDLLKIKSIKEADSEHPIASLNKVKQSKEKDNLLEEKVSK